jgi:hypothetical protein
MLIHTNTPNYPVIIFVLKMNIIVEMPNFGNLSRAERKKTNEIN